MAQLPPRINSANNPAPDPTALQNATNARQVAIDALDGKVPPNLVADPVEQPDQAPAVAGSKPPKPLIIERKPSTLSRTGLRGAMVASKPIPTARRNDPIGAIIAGNSGKKKPPQKSGKITTDLLALNP